MITALEVDQLSLDRGGRPLFEGLSFTLAAGQALTLNGPNGAGKTSLLRAIAGLLRPVAGEVRFRAGDSLLAAREARAQGLHWLGALDGLKGSRTAQAELDFWSSWNGGSLGSGSAALERMGLADQAGLAVRRLSTGQRRRLALARLLTRPRPLWLLDEPLAPLDAAWRARAGELMRSHLDEGGLIIAAVHDPLPVSARELRLETV